MGGPTSVTTENPQPRRKGEAYCSKETSSAVIDDDIEAAYSDDERPPRVLGPARPRRPGC